MPTMPALVSDLRSLCFVPMDTAATREEKMKDRKSEKDKDQQTHRLIVNPHSIKSRLYQWLSLFFRFYFRT